MIDPNAFIGCSSLISVELPEKILIAEPEGGFARLEGCPSLLVSLSIATLRQNGGVMSGLLHYDLRLGTRLVDDGADLIRILKHRFDNSPRQNLCYYSSGDTMMELLSGSDFHKSMSLV
eukprot:scaffold4117_cov97-Cylindrotheca_fusiformis.AAC.4